MDASPLAASIVGKFDVCFDAVYNPLETKLLQEARACGKCCVSGVEMFVGQAAAQFEAFTGREAPVELMRSEVLRRLGSQ